MPEVGLTHAFVAVIALVVGILIGGYFFRQGYTFGGQCDHEFRKVLDEAGHTDLDKILDDKLMRVDRLDNELDDVWAEIENAQDSTDSVLGRELHNRRAELQQKLDEAELELARVKGLAYLAGYGKYVERFYERYPPMELQSSRKAVDIFAGDS